MVINLFFYKHWLIKHIGTQRHRVRRIHTCTLFHPQPNNTNKEPFLIKATSLNTRSILLSPSERSTLIHTRFFLFVADLSRCIWGFMSGLLWLAKKQCTDSICKLEEEGEGGNGQGTRGEMIWTWCKASRVYLWYERLSKTKTHKQSDRGNDVKEERDQISL